MGSGALLTTHEAAALINVTTATVRRLTQDQLLRPHYEKVGAVARPFYERGELEAYVEAKTSTHSARRRMIVSQQNSAGLKSLERRMKYVEDMLGVHLRSPALDEESMTSVYNRADDDLHEPPTQEEAVMFWARFFMSVGEEYFDLLEAQTDDDNCWRIFYELGAEMLRVAPTDRFIDEPLLKVAYGYLEAGRRNLRNTLFFYLRTRVGIRTANTEVGPPESIHDQILNYIASGD